MDSNSVALQTIYPEHNWEESKFRKQRNHWKDLTKHRAFFDQMATKLRIYKTTEFYQERD